MPGASDAANRFLHKAVVDQVLRSEGRIERIEKRAVAPTRVSFSSFTNSSV